MKALAVLTRMASNLLIWIAGIGLIAMTFIVAWQVFGRFILKASPSWSEQSALTLMIWFVTLAAAGGVREGFHIRITVIEDMLGTRARNIMRIFAELIVGLIGASMLIWGGELVIRTWSHDIPSLGISRGLAYLGIPLAGALIALFSLERILEILSGKQLDEKEVA